MFTSLWTAGMGFLRRPIAIVASLLTALSMAFLNDRYAFSCLFYFIFMYSFGDLFRRSFGKIVNEDEPRNSSVFTNVVLMIFIAVCPPSEILFFIMIIYDISH